MSGLVDLSLLPAPAVVNVPDYETLLAERKAALLALVPENQRDAVTQALALESEPLTQLLEESTLRELLERQRVNEAAQAVMLACSTGSDLDNLVASFNIRRLTIREADTTVTPPRAAVMESDADLRLRAQQAFEGLSVAGPSQAYIFHGCSADGRVADISAVSPSPACVTITVLSRDGDGTADDDLLAVVTAALNDEEVRPVADRVTVQSATIVPYQIEATLWISPGPAAGPVRQAAEDRLKSYIATRRRLGRDIRISAIHAALHAEGVQRVELTQPAADLVLDSSQASWCTAYTISVGGYDD